MSELKITKKRTIKKRSAGATELANKPTMLLVLGMHRSGTSVTARLMECLGGVNSSNLHPPLANNPKGFFEDYDIEQLNEYTVLPSLGIKWHSVGFVDWSRLSSSDRSKFALQAVEIVRKNYNPANSLSILKEPRIGILLPFWLSVLRHAGYNVKVVCAVRDPISVARSLQKRDGLSTTHGGMLYVTNWLSILNYIQELPVAFVSFEEVFQDPAAVLRKVSEKLQIRPPQDFEVRVHQFASDFINPALCHHRIESQDLALETDLPPLAIEAYEHLLAAAQFQNIKKTGRFVPNSEKRIASIKPVLEDFDRLLQRLHQENSRNADLQKSYEVTKSIADQSTASIQASQEQARQLIQKEALQRGEMAERLTRLNTEKASLEAALAEAHAQRQALSTELEHEKTRSADAAKPSAETNAACISLQEEATAAQTQAAQLQQRIHELEAANNQLASERGEMAEHHSALNAEKSSLEACLTETQAQSLALGSELEQKKARTATSQGIGAEANAACISLQEEATAAQTQAAQLQQRIQELEAANSQLASERGEMAEHHSALNAENSSLEACLTETQAQSLALGSELEQEKARAATSQGIGAEANAEKAYFQELFAASQNQLSQTQQHIRELETAIGQANQELGEMVERLTHLEAEKTKAESAILMLQRENQELSEEKLHIKKSHSDLEASLQERFEELAKMAKMIIERDETVERLQSEIEKKINAHAELAQEIETHKNEKENLKTALHAAAVNNEELETRGANLQHNVNERFHELSKCAQIILAKDKELEESLDNIAKIKNSISWKATNFMRSRLLRYFTKPERILRKNIKVLNKSGLFDRNYYLTQYPDIADAKIDPIRHYLEFGVREMRKPSDKP
jgi:hypothetical protein